MLIVIEVYINSFKIISCASSSNGQQQLNISYSAPWRDCPIQTSKDIYEGFLGVQEENFGPPEQFEQRLTEIFKGIKLHRSKSNPGSAIFPIIETDVDVNAFAWGFDWNYRGFLFPVELIILTIPEE